MLHHKEKNGFTLIELLLTIAIFAIIVSISLPLMNTYIRRNDLSTATSLSIEAIRKAKTMVNLQNADWGVLFSSSSATVFKGNNFSSRIQEFDRDYKLNGVIVSSTQVIFSSSTGETSSTSISLTTENGTKKININKKGVVSISE